MSALNESSLNLLFTEAHTHNAPRPWLDKPVTEAQLRQIYELARMAPTAANCQPLRVAFVKGASAKERLKPGLNPTNVEKTMNAPVTAILAFDREFYEKFPKLFPLRDMRTPVAGMPAEARDQMGAMNATLQAGYFILAARSIGLDCGPMGGFDKTKVDAEFFPDGKWKSIVLVNLGYGDPAKVFPRQPRLDFEEACRIE